MKHFRLGLWPHQYVNIPAPFRPHTVVVIGRGRLMKNSKFNNWLPCCYILPLEHCCGRSPE